MQKNNQVLFVVNPVSGNGRTYKKWLLVEQILRRKGHVFAVRFTEAQLHARQITAEALKSGYNHIIAVGGDGTINEVLNGFYHEGEDRDREAALSVVPMGTGSDFSRILDISSHPDYIEKLLYNGEAQHCDVVEARYTDWDGRDGCRYYINIADMGIGSEAVYRVNKRSKVMGGFLSFLYAGLVSIIKFKNPRVSVEVDGQVLYTGESSLVAVSNGKYFGGGFMIAPQAEINDGKMDIVVFEGLSKGQCLSLLPSLYKGTHLADPRVRSAKGQEVKVRSAERIYLEVDGESPGTGDVHFKILPADLKLVV